MVRSSLVRQQPVWIFNKMYAHSALTQFGPDHFGSLYPWDQSKARLGPKRTTPPPISDLSTEMGILVWMVNWLLIFDFLHRTICTCDMLCIL
jgi:hypothetical protein